MKEEVKSVVDYFLEGHNVSETAAYFHKARKSVNLILDSVVNEDGNNYDKILAEKIILMKKKLLIEARRKAGAKSKREIVISDDEALEIIYKIINKGSSLRDLSMEYNCSHTTISKAVKRVASLEELEQIKQIYNEKGTREWKR